MGKGAKLISFPVLPQAWQTKRSTWRSSSRARARMSRRPQVLLHSWCQLSPLTLSCTVSNTSKNIWSCCFLQRFLQQFHRFPRQILDFNSSNAILFVRFQHQIVFWMPFIVVDAPDKIILQEEKEIQIIIVYKQTSYILVYDTSWPEGLKSIQIRFSPTIRTWEKHLVNIELSLPF